MCIGTAEPYLSIKKIIGKQQNVSGVKIISTHVASSSANLFEQNKVFT